MHSFKGTCGCCTKLCNFLCQETISGWNIAYKAIVQQSGWLNHLTAEPCWSQYIKLNSDLQTIYQLHVFLNLPPKSLKNEIFLFTSLLRATKPIVQCRLHVKRANARHQDCKILCFIRVIFMLSCRRNISAVCITWQFAVPYDPWGMLSIWIWLHELRHLQLNAILIWKHLVFYVTLCTVPKRYLYLPEKSSLVRVSATLDPERWNVQITPSKLHSTTMAVQSHHHHPCGRHRCFLDHCTIATTILIEIFRASSSSFFLLPLLLPQLLTREMSSSSKRLLIRERVTPPSIPDSARNVPAVKLLLPHSNAQSAWLFLWPTVKELIWFTISLSTFNFRLINSSCSAAVDRVRNSSEKN